MKTFYDVYKINGMTGIYSLEYIQEHRVPMSDRFTSHLQGYASPVRTKNAKDSVSIIQADGTKKKAYTYGEKMWSYDKEERDAYRAEQNAEYEALKEHNRLIKAIMAHYENKSNDELKKILSEM